MNKQRRQLAFVHSKLFLGGCPQSALPWKVTLSFQHLLLLACCGLRSFPFPGLGCYLLDILFVCQVSVFSSAHVEADFDLWVVFTCKTASPILISLLLTRLPRAKTLAFIYLDRCIQGCIMPVCTSRPAAPCLGRSGSRGLEGRECDEHGHATGLPCALGVKHRARKDYAH